MEKSSGRAGKHGNIYTFFRGYTKLEFELGVEDSWVLIKGDY